jgi:hypothetical protein
MNQNSSVAHFAEDFEHQPSNDLRTHYMILFLEKLPLDVKKAHLTWMPDKDGRKRTIDELNLDQLGVHILCRSTTQNTQSGWIYFRGELSQTHYSKD